MAGRGILLRIMALGLVVALIYTRIRRYLTVRAFKRAHKCAPAIVTAQPERILGISSFLKILATRRERKCLELTFRRAVDVGRTTTTVLLGQDIVFTCDPENLKTVLATNFPDYGIGARLGFMGPLLGQGIFTSDDVAWQHSRVSFPGEHDHKDTQDVD